MYKNKSEWRKPKANVKYSIKAILETLDNKVMKYKQLLIIQEPPV
eukprot:CAMPEP_0168608892 /NCGR_PEP_ID=MMETSP0449_2-20121227/896_1 /TAXON_ID=1082188 /ORGANISM="Strombidium rassoulzadegani, Strain ras09" /LENGTH=44 /DNA_ID= /DNA_START= /DNA_END= /DNA_ORIENTATION=